MPKVRRFPGMLLAAVAMAVLVGILAVLQYHWVGQLSADERERMRASLADRAHGVRDDFNRELTRAFFWLGVGQELRRDRPPESDEERYARWFASAPRPEMVSQIYRVEVDGSGRYRLSRFDRDAARLEETEWPRALLPIRERLDQILEARRKDEATSVRLPLTWPELPALLIPHPRVIDGRPFDGGPRVPPLAPLLGGGSYTIALLDQGYLARELLPALAERHFALSTDTSVHVGLVGPRGLMYAAPVSTPPPALVSAPDVTVDLFDIRFFEFNRFVVDRRAGPPAPGAAAPRSTLPPGVPPLPSPGAPGPSASQPPPMRTDTMVAFVGRDDRGRGGARGGPSGQSSWRVQVLHRAGSLEAAVTHARWRNLLVSFGVLILLTASVGMVLASTQRARRLAAQQMEFVAGVSHELRTPLAVIRSAAENLADGVVAEPTQVKRYGEVIAAEGRRLTGMVEQILEFAGFQSGRATLEARPASVADLVARAVRAVEHALREHRGTLEQSVPADLPLVLADEGAVSRSIQNLVVNALKYGGTPPQVRLEAARRADRPEFVTLTVTDNGQGIAASDLPHIFEPFYRGADGLARQIHGSGLGLSLVKRIMEELGGRVTVKTEPGRGSAFTLHLAVAPETVRAAGTADSSAATQAASLHKRQSAT